MALKTKFVFVSDYSSIKHYLYLPKDKENESEVFRQRHYRYLSISYLVCAQLLGLCANANNRKEDD